MVNGSSDKELVNMELEWWGLPTIEEQEKVQEVQKILNSEPSNLNQVVLSKWKELGPLNL